MVTMLAAGGRLLSHLSPTIWPCSGRSQVRTHHGHSDPGLPVRPGPHSTAAARLGVPLRRRPVYVQLEPAAGAGTPRPAPNQPSRGDSLDAAGPPAGVEPGQGPGRPLVGREQQGSLLLRPGRARSGPQELDRLPIGAPQGPPSGLPAQETEGTLPGCLPVHHRRDQGAGGSQARSAT
jgi:hypothetical protein